MIRGPVLLLAASMAGCALQENEAPKARRPPNVLFVAVDDLNDWIEPLGGHPQARTPNLARLAAESVNFTRSYCASPACNPSRTALLTGRHTFRSGLYSNYQVWREVLPDAVTMPRWFAQHGYWAAGAGKIFHNNMPDPRSWDAYFPSLENHMPSYVLPNPGGTVNMPLFENMYVSFDWAPLDVPVERTGDHRSVAWVIDQLGQERDGPFFLACGIYRPHLPWYVPREFFDMFPLESVQLPAVLEGDLDDLGPRAREIAERGGNYHEHVLAAGQWRQAVQGYLASIAYADHLVGELLAALEASPHAENTIVVLWSDHGWQLGEKRHWRKFALWDNVARTVLMVRVPPGIAPGLPEGTPARPCHRVVSLVDLYPTLLELCGIESAPDLDGRSLVPLLRDPEAPWDHPAITTYDFAEFSIRTERWRYIRYIDGSEELYDHDADPEEWRNLASDPEQSQVLARMRALVPGDPAPFVDTSYRIEPHHFPPYRSVEDYLQRNAK